MMNPIGIKYFTFGIISLMPIFASCQNITKYQCQQLDWSNLGEQDARKGEGDKLKERLNRCKHIGVNIAMPIQQDYQQAYNTVIATYCQAPNIYKLGLKGQGNIEVCLTQQYQHLKPLHESALRFYHNRKKIEDLYKTLQRIDKNSALSKQEKIIETTRVNQNLEQLLRYQRLLQQEMIAYF